VRGCWYISDKTAKEQQHQHCQRRGLTGNTSYNVIT